MTDLRDPPRWREPNSGAPAALQRFLSESERDLPTKAQLSAISQRLERELAFVPGPPAASPPGSALSTAKIAGLIGVIGLLGVAGVRAFAPTGALPAVAPVASVPQSPPPVASDVSEGPAPPAAAAPFVPVPEPSVAPSSGSKVSVPPRSRATSGASEVELLERARRALGSDPRRALALTQEHRARFPGGVLGQEREVIAIEALRRLGRSEEAGRRAGSFEQRYPDSAHRRSVEQGLGK
ncbi:MAG TPA: hypothetical protein VIM73_09995 [Polyangiaceae bacterium]